MTYFKKQLWCCVGCGFAVALEIGMHLLKPMPRDIYTMAVVAFCFGMTATLAIDAGYKR